MADYTSNSYEVLKACFDPQNGTFNVNPDNSYEVLKAVYDSNDEALRVNILNLPSGSGGTSLWENYDIPPTTGVYATFDGIPVGCSTSVLITADNIGVVGNAIGIGGNGTNTITQIISNWNSSNPSNTATLTSGDGSQVPANKSLAALSGGVDASAGGNSTGVQVIYDPQKAFAVGDYSVTGGVDNYANGLESFAMNSHNYANGRASACLGGYNYANGENSMAVGFQTKANGDNSFSSGVRTTATGNGSFACGFAPIDGAEINAIGNGTFVGGFCKFSGSTNEATSYSFSFQNINTVGVFGAYGTGSAIIGASNSIITSLASSSFLTGTYNNISEKNSAILGGNNNDVSGKNSAIIGGENQTLTEDNTVMVPNLVVNDILTTNSIFAPGGLIINPDGDDIIVQGFLQSSSS